MNSRQLFWTLFFLVASIFLIYFLRGIILIFLFSLILAAGLRNYIDFLSRKGVPRLISLLVIYFSFFVLFSFLFYFFSGPVFSQFRLFILNTGAFWQKVQDQPILGQVFSLLPSLKENWQKWLTKISSPENLFKISFGVINNIASLILSLILVFYLTVQKDGLEKFFAFFVPKGKEEKFNLFWQRVNKKIYRWFNTQIILCFAVGFASFIFLRIISVPYSLLLGVLAGLLEIFPFIGPFIAGLIAVIVASQKSLVLALVVAIGYLIIQQAESHLLIPNLMAKRVDLNPVVVIFLVLVGAKLMGGIIGALIAIPLGLILREILVSFSEE